MSAAKAPDTRSQRESEAERAAAALRPDIKNLEALAAKEDFARTKAAGQADPKTIASSSDARDAIPRCSECRGCGWAVSGRQWAEYKTVQCSVCGFFLCDASAALQRDVLSALRRCAHRWGPLMEEFGSLPGRECALCALLHVDPDDRHA